MAIGSVIGGSLGALVGSIVPGAGTSAGYALGSSIGGTAEGLYKMGLASQKTVDEVDPRQRLLLDEIVRKRKALETGTMYSPQQDAVRQAGARALVAATSVAGGDVGATLSALSNINRGTGRNLNELYGTMSAESLRALELQKNLTDIIAMRSGEVQKQQQQQALGDAAQTTQGGLQSLSGYVARTGLNAALNTDAGQTGELSLLDLARSLVGGGNKQQQQADPRSVLQNAIGGIGGITGNAIRTMLPSLFPQQTQQQPLQNSYSGFGMNEDLGINSWGLGPVNTPLINQRQPLLNF